MDDSFDDCLSLEVTRRGEAGHSPRMQDQSVFRATSARWAPVPRCRSSVHTLRWPLDFLARQDSEIWIISRHDTDVIVAIPLTDGQAFTSISLSTVTTQFLCPSITLTHRLRLQSRKTHPLYPLFQQIFHMPSPSPSLLELMTMNILSCPTPHQS
jgi:hypothetical protein